MTWTFRLTDNLDPEERLEEAALWKAMHDEYGDMVKPITGNVAATFGRTIRAQPGLRLEYWSDPAFLSQCQRRFSVVPFDQLELAVGELHEDGLGAFIKSTRDKHAIFRVPVGRDLRDEMDAMVYSFIDGGPELMVQELCEIADEHRFFCIAREIVTFSRNSPELTPLDFPSRQSDLSKALLPLCAVAQQIAATMQMPDAVIDVAYINGVPGAVELNPFWLGQVGLFACDVRALAEAARHSAQAMSARQGQDQQGLGAKPASAVGSEADDAPNPPNPPIQSTKTAEDISEDQK